MPSGLTSHEKVVAWARTKIGQKEVPAGSNSGPFVEFCQQSTWLGGTGWPWCVAFCQRAWQQSGRPLPYLGAGAYQLLKWARKEGWAVPLEKARPGDIVVWNIGAGHASLFERLHGQTVTTVDGNVSDMVARRQRSRSLVRGVVGVREAAPRKQPKPPVFEVVRSESGHTVVAFTGGKARMLHWLKHHTIKGRVWTIRQKKEA